MPQSLVAEFDTTLLGQSLAIQRRRTTCGEMFERCRAAVAAREESVRAWVRFGGDDVERLVEERDAELRRGLWRGPLHGIPVGVKDIYDVAGQPTLAGIPNFAAEPAVRDAVLVARLRRAGAIIAGKTVTTAYAYFDPPPTRNPWNLERTPGGSSSGSAAAVASGMCLGALGSQTGGSITRPAAFCGIAGYKPTFGLLSRAGVFPLAPSLDHPGPMARTVEDLVCLMAALAPASWRTRFRALLAEAPHAHVETCEDRGHYQVISPRLGLVVLDGDVAEKADPAAKQAVDQIIRHCGCVGAGIGWSDAEVLELPKLWACHRTMMAVEIAMLQAERLQRYPEQFSPAVRGLIEEGVAARSVDYAAALLFRRELRRRAITAIEDHVWALPSARGAAPTPETTGDPCMNSPWSFLGFPTITVPLCLSAEGLPLGLQLVAAPGRDIELFRTARWCEIQIRDWAQRSTSGP